MMTIEVKVNSTKVFESLTEKMHDVKSVYGKMFYHDTEVKSVEITLDGITFLQLKKDDNGKVILRYDVKSEEV